MHDKFSDAKKKQYFYMAAAVSVIAGSIVLLSSAFQKDTPQGPIEQPKLNIIDKKDTDEKTFRKEFGENDAAQSAQIKLLQKKLAELEGGGGVQQQGFSQTPMPNQPLPNSSQQNSIPNIMMPPPPPPTSPAKAPEVVDSKPEKPEPPKTMVMGDMIGMISGAAPAPEAKPAPENKSNIKKIEIPSGSFMGGVILSGIDAPTGGKATKSPHPVLIKVTNITRLPNKFKANIKECHILGSGYGDLSSERAFVRVEKISCMTEDGRAIEKGDLGKSIGYVTGEDGKVGIPGRVVSKQGAILARTLAAGFLEGVAKGFSQSTMSYSVQPTGSVATPDPNMLAERGIAVGASEATKKLADFYMKLANEMFPVVEVAAGRKVDVVLLEKLSFDLDEKDAK